MFHIAKWITPVLTLALLVCVNGSARADDGTISGVVKNADGTPAASARVYVWKPEVKADKAEAKADEPGKEKPKKAKPVADATTDAQGKVTVEVLAGDYKVTAVLLKIGKGGENVSVKSGETAKVTINLKPFKG